MKERLADQSAAEDRVADDRLRFLQETARRRKRAVAADEHVARVRVAVEEAVDEHHLRERRADADEVEGLLLNRSSDEAEAARVLDHEALNLHPLTRGMDIVRSTSTGRAVLRLADPRSPGNWHTSALSRAAGTITGKARFAAYARTVA